MSVYDEIRKEREYQDGKWGHKADDTLNTPNDFIAYMNAYSTRWFPGGFTPYTPEVVDAYRKSMLKTAALAVAAIESLDRQRQEKGSAFFEDGERGPKVNITSPRGGN